MLALKLYRKKKITGVGGNNKQKTNKKKTNQKTLRFDIFRVMFYCIDNVSVEETVILEFRSVSVFFKYFFKMNCNCAKQR